MTVKRSGLGRNLSALLGTSGENLLQDKPLAEALKLAIHCLQPGKYQPRIDMDEEGLKDLAASIKKQGLLQPLLVRELKDGRYEIIAGERRWRASQMAGLTEISVILKQVDDETAMAMALVENLQREDLNAMDQARALYRLTSEFALTHQQIADLLSKSRTAVSNYLRLLSLCASVKKLVEHGDLDMGHARALLSLEEQQQQEVAQIIVAKQLSVRETEKLVERVRVGKFPPKDKTPTPTTYQPKIQNLSEKLKTKIQLKPGKSGRGSLIIHYKNDTMLEQLIAQLEIEGHC